jgi:hypothetical protein
MLDPNALEQLIQTQVKEMVTDQVLEVFSSDTWLKPVEQKIIQYTQDHLLKKFSNANAVPEIIDAVKQGVVELFTSGQIPGLETFIDQSTITNSVNQAVQQAVELSMKSLGSDPAWLERVEKQIDQAVIRQALTYLSTTDINTVIQQRVDENIDRFQEKLRENFSTVGIVDQATKNQMTVMDEATVFENTLVTNNLQVADSTIVKNLVVQGSVNTDSFAWDSLSASIQEKTLKQFNDELQEQMIQDITNIIKSSGIDINQIKFGGQVLAEDNRLSSTITETNIQKLGTLHNLRVSGITNLNETLNVHKKRVGVNTEEPEMALSVWDEEVAINIGKHKEKIAYIGTSRAQGIAIGTNRVAHIEVTADGLTQIKKLQVGLHKISHDIQVPGWSGTRGDIVFNSNPTNNVFAWVCLGAFKWQPLKSAE